MKKVLIIVALSTTFVGCASQPKMTVETALHNCMRVGFKVGTDPMTACINHQLAQNNQMTFAQQYILARAQGLAQTQNNTEVLPKTIQCGRVGSYVNCTER